jgi:hypothetical protein
MIQEQKDLLLKDLCARLPYGVKVQVDNHCWVDFRKDIPVKLTLDNSYRILLGVTLGYVKPYLFPLSSMTEEQKQYLKNRFCYDWNGEPYDIWKCQIEIGDADELIDFFHKNHLDYHNLIPKGLAINATGLDIYIDY